MSALGIGWMNPDERCQRDDQRMKSDSHATFGIKPTLLSLDQ
jgi:hypothetical protein